MRIGNRDGDGDGVVCSHGDKALNTSQLWLHYLFNSHLNEDVTF